MPRLPLFALLQQSFFRWQLSKQPVTWLDVQLQGSLVLEREFDWPPVVGLARARELASLALSVH